MYLLRLLYSCQCDSLMLEIQCSHICVWLGKLQWFQFCSAATPPPFTGARGSRLSEGALWRIVGGCIALVLIVAII